MHALQKPLLLVGLCLAVITGCSPNATQPAALPTLVVLPTSDQGITPELKPSTGTAIPATTTYEPTVDQSIQSGIDSLFTQTAQVQAELAPTETLLALFNQVLTQTSEAAIKGTLDSVRADMATISAEGTVAASAAIEATAAGLVALQTINTQNAGDLEQLAIIDNSGVFAFSPDGELLAVGGYSEVTLIDTNSLLTLTTLQSATARGAVSDIAFSDNGRLLAFAVSTSGAASVWDIESHQEIRVLNDRQFQITSVAVDDTGERIATGNSGGQVLIWDVLSGDVERVLVSEDYGRFTYDLRFQTRSLLRALQENSVAAWSVETGMQVSSVSFGASLQPLNLSPDGTRIAFVSSGSNRGRNNANYTVVITDPNLGPRVDLDLVNFPSAVAFNALNSLLAVVDSNYVTQNGLPEPALHIWDISSGTELFSTNFATGGRSLVFSPTNKFLVSLGDSGIVLWGIRSGS